MTTKFTQLATAGTLTGAEVLALSQPSATVTITATTLSAVAADNSYNDSANGFVTAGFVVGMAVRVQGFTGNVANNIFTGTLTSVAAGKIIVGGTDGDVIVDDAAGESVTITAWVSARTTAQGVVALIAATPILATGSPAASSNTTILNAALAAGGTVLVSKPGTYLFNGTLLIPSDTHLVIGPGVVLKLADSTNLTLIANAKAFNGPTATLASVIEWTTGAPDAGGTPSFRATINHTGIGTLHPVNTWIAVLPAVTVPNPTTPFTAGFAGIYQVKTASANQITYDMMAQPPGGGNSATGGTIYAVDTNIRVSGGGTLDGNGANQGAVYGASHPYTNLTWWHNCQNLAVDGITIKRAKAWGIASNSVADFIVRDIHAETYQAVVSANDAVHMTGPHQRGVVENIFGACSDNLVGLTADDDALFPYWHPGDTDAIIIRNIHSNDGTVAGIVGVWGSPKYQHRSVLVDGVHGKGGAGVVSANYATTGMTGCTGGTLVIRGVHARVSSQSVSLESTGNWGVVDISDIRNESVNGAATINVFINAAQTITTLAIKGVVSGLSTKSNPLVQITDAVIGSLLLADILNIPLLANVAAFKLTGVAACSRIVINNCSASGASGTGALLSITSTATQGEVLCNDSVYTGTSSTGNLLRFGASSPVSSLTVNGCRVVTAAAQLSATTLGRLTGANAQFDGSNITTPVAGDAFYNTNASFGAGVGNYVRGASAWARIDGIITSAPAFSATPTLDTSVADAIYFGALTANVTAFNLSGTRAKVIVCFVQDGTGSRTVTAGTSIDFGADIPDLTGIRATASTYTYVGFVYNPTTTKFRVVAISK